MSELMHYGRSKKDGAIVGSGRYPLGSGEDPYQHVSDFYSEYTRLRKEEHLKPVEIAARLGMVGKDGKPSTTKLRAKLTIERNKEQAARQAYAVKLKEHIDEMD